MKLAGRIAFYGFVTVWLVAVWATVIDGWLWTQHYPDGTSVRWTHWNWQTVQHCGWNTNVLACYNVVKNQIVLPLDASDETIDHEWCHRYGWRHEQWHPAEWRDFPPCWGRPWLSFVKRHPQPSYVVLTREIYDYLEERAQWLVSVRGDFPVHLLLDKPSR